MKKHTKMIAMIALMSLLVMILAGCSSEHKDTTAVAEPVLTTVPVLASEPEALPEKMGGSQRQDGERFEDVIMLEGMEETVRYEHVRNDAMGIAMDYDYESFVRRSGPASECFISCYDNADSPENFLELIYSEENADSAAASIAERLSQTYNIIQDTRVLNKAGTCAHIDASADKNDQTPDQLQSVYVIPVSNGCVIATSRYSFEAADGFGKRFSEMLNTLEVLNSSK